MTNVAVKELEYDMQGLRQAACSPVFLIVISVRNLIVRSYMSLRASEILETEYRGRKQFMPEQQLVR